jgi:hypothetical protein
MIAHPSAVTYPRLAFTVDKSFVALFFLLLQQGVKIRRRIGCSAEAFLREELGAGPAMIEKIQSIMLDGKPVDDIRVAMIHDGSVLALSAAMPGLVGATLRRGGAYSSFRSAITYHETETVCAPGEGWVCIKLFNLLMSELGPDLLRQGVLIKAADLACLLMERAGDLRRGCSATIDGKPIDVWIPDGSSALAGRDQVLLTVAIGPVTPDLRI